MSLARLPTPAARPNALIPQAAAMCVGFGPAAMAYPYAWLRARELAAGQAWERFDPRWN